MAFDIESFDNISSGAAKGPRMFSYGSTTDTLATILTAGYFDSVKFRIDQNDMIYVSASDGVEQIKITSANGQPATTVTYVPASGGAPNNATYITQTLSGDLPNEQALADLATGLLKSTTATGVLSSAVSNVDYQAADAGLISIAGLTTAADTMIYTTASDVYATTGLTAAGRAILDDADAAAQLVTLGAQAAISGASLTAVTAATDDKIVIQDTSDSNNIKSTTVQSVLDLAGGGGVFTQIAVPITNAQFLDLSANPFVLLAAQGADTFINVVSFFLKYNYIGGGVFTGGSNLQFGRGGAPEGLFDTSLLNLIPTTLIIYPAFSSQGASGISGNLDLTLHIDGANFATGTGNFVAYITYEVVTVI